MQFPPAVTPNSNPQEVAIRAWTRYMRPRYGLSPIFPAGGNGVKYKLSCLASQHSKSDYNVLKFGVQGTPYLNSSVLGLILHTRLLFRLHAALHPNASLFSRTRCHSALEFIISLLVSLWQVGCTGCCAADSWTMWIPLVTVHGRPERRNFSGYCVSYRKLLYETSVTVSYAFAINNE
jgi:hypothetical protein